MSEHSDLESWLHARIHDTRILLMEITTPKTPSQEMAHRNYTRRLNMLEVDTKTDPLDTKAAYGNDIETIKINDFKASVHNIEHETSIAYNKLSAQEAHSIKPKPTRPHPETSIEDRLYYIEALLEETEVVAGEARQREYALRTERLISEAKTNLLAIEARHGDYATFHNEMILMAPYGKKLDIYTYELPDLRIRISERIYITGDLLTRMTSPIHIQNLPQELAYEGYIKKSRELTQEAMIDILDIETNHREDISPTELENFKTSLHNTSSETLAIYSDIWVWKTSHARPPAGANEECAATMEAKPSPGTLCTKTHNPNQGRDNEESSMGKETDSKLATGPPDGSKHATTRKPLQITRKYESSLQEVIEHDNYQTTEYHAISCDCNWKEKMKKISKDMTKINNGDLKWNDNINLNPEDRVNHLQNLTSPAARKLETADANQYIFSKRTPRICPQEIPKYAGTPSEDFIDFKEDFLTAMKRNRTAKPDHLHVLQEALTGHATQKIPPGYEHTIHDGWAALEEISGKPIRYINYQIKSLNQKLLTPKTDDLGPI